jgi:hypothetical protein
MLVSCLAYSSNLKMEATRFSEASADFQQTTRRYIIIIGVRTSNPTNKVLPIPQELRYGDSGCHRTVETEFTEFLLTMHTEKVLKTSDSRIARSVWQWAISWKARARFPAGLTYFLFPSASRPALGPHPAYHIGTAGSEADRLPQSSTEVRNRAATRGADKSLAL